MVEEKVFTPDNLEEFEQDRMDVTYRFCRFEGLVLGDMVGRNFQNCVFVDCAFKENAKDKNGKDIVRPANISRSVMTGCLVRNCDLAGVRAQDFGSFNTDFIDSDLSKASFLGVSFEKGALEGCKVDRMVLDGNISGVKFANLVGKAVANDCNFTADDESFEFNNSIDFYKSLVRSEVNKHVLHFNDFTVVKSVRDEHRGVTVSRRFFHTDAYNAFLRQSERGYRNKVYSVVRSAGPQMGLVTDEQKKQYIEQETKKYLDMVAKDIQESFDFMRKYNSSSKRDAYVAAKAAELYHARDNGNLSAKREAADMSYRSAALQALAGKVTKKTLNSKSWKEAEEAILGYRQKDEEQRIFDGNMYIRAAYEKSAEKRGIANRDWEHIRKQQVAENREREDMTHDREVTDIRDVRQPYLDNVRMARENVVEAAKKVRDWKQKTATRVTIEGYNEDGSPIVSKEEYQKEEVLVSEKPFEYRMTLGRNASSSGYFHNMMLDAVSSNSASLDSKVDVFMNKLCKGELRYRKDSSGKPLYNEDGKLVTVMSQSRIPGLERYGSCGSTTVSRDKKTGVVSLTVGTFRKGTERFSVIGRYDPSGSGKLSLVISGELKDDTRAKLDKFLMEDEIFRGMSRGIVKLDSVSVQRKNEEALSEAKSALKQARDVYKEVTSSDDYRRKEDAEVENQLFAVSSGVLDYSGNSGQFKDTVSRNSNRRDKNRSSADVSVSKKSEVVSYRFYIPVDCKQDVTELYPLLDGVEDRDLSVLSKRAEAMDKVMSGLGFVRAGGVSVTERDGDTEGRLGRYTKDNASITVRAVTDNKAGTGYYEVVSHGISSADESFVSLVRHSEMFSGLDIYNGSPSLKSSKCIGRNDGSLGLDGSSKDDKSVDSPVVDMSDVGKNKGKGMDSL